MKLLYRLVAIGCVLPLMAGTRCISEVDLPPFSLPPITQTGANTFGFVVDGRVWRDYGTGCAGIACDSNTARVNYHNTRRGEYDLVAGLTTKQHYEYMRIYLQNVRQPGTYGWAPSNSTQPWASLVFEDKHSAPDKSYLGRRTRPYFVSITRLDTVQRIISGTFSGTLKQLEDSTQTVTIADGRFDLRYR